MNLKPLYTKAEAAEYLRFNVRTVEYYIKQGRIHGLKIGGQWRIQADELRWIAANGLHPTSTKWKEQARRLQARYRLRKAERELAAAGTGDGGRTSVNCH